MLAPKKPMRMDTTMNIRETLKSIPADKAFHFIAGWAIVATLFPFFPTFAIIAVIVASAWKEWDDSKHGGDSDIWDFTVMVLGGVCAALAFRFLSLF